MRAKFLLPLILPLMGCGSGVSTTIEPESANTADSGVPSVRDPNDTSHPLPTSDAYLPCQISTTLPTGYPRLTERFCTDSNGLTYSKGYWDTSLNISCHWDTSSDMQTRCLPDNVQTNPVYADGACQDSIALVQDGAPLYIGLEHTENGRTWVNVYQAGRVWNSNDFYYMAQFEGEWDCFSTRMFFPGLKLRYVGVEVKPTLFVQK